MRGADCSTDRKLVVSDISWKLRTKVRRQKRSGKKFVVAALQDPVKREHFQIKLREALEGAATSHTQLEAQIENAWHHFATTVKKIAEKSIGLKKRSHRDWFDENYSEIGRSWPSKTGHITLPKKNLHPSIFESISKKLEALSRENYQGSKMSGGQW